MQIKELILETASLQRTRLFYSRTLELPLISETEDAISFQAGRSVLTFKPAEDKKPFYHFAFNITNNKFSDSFEWINQKLDILPVNNEMLIAGYDDWNAQSFYFHDNNGSILEFIVRFDLPYHSEAPFSSDCIEEISEIGLVANYVPETAEDLNKEHGIPYFAKGPRLPDFIAMGDETGLVLVSQNKRGWVPTNKPAQKFPLTLVTGEDQVLRFS
ncbi:MAG: VOC family protein [Sphingobacteriales bacterium]|nr:MAG: VOC family protein [Sphingobacteriales bacterium]